jgi:acyl-coenzyme A thioesterase 13
MLTVTEAEEHDVPPGFEAFHSSPFFAMIGPAWIRQADSPPSFGIRIEQRHTNTGGTAHGGLLAALADMTLGQGVRASLDHDLHLVTAGLTIDFALPVRTGDWVQAQADIQHRSRRTVFASCYLISNGHRAVRASGIYTIANE